MKKLNRVAKRLILTLSFILAIMIVFYPASTFAEPTTTPTLSPPPELTALPGDLEPGCEVYCTHNGVNLRDTPSTSHSNVLAVLKRHDRLIFLGWTDAGWVHVQFGDINGYCSARYIEYDPNAAPTPAPTSTPVPSATQTSVPTPSPSPSPIYEPTATPKQAPPASTSGYMDTWAQRDITKKLTSIPVWLFGFLALAFILVIIYKIVESRRK